MKRTSSTIRDLTQKASYAASKLWRLTRKAIKNANNTVLFLLFSLLVLVVAATILSVLTLAFNQDDTGKTVSASTPASVQGSINTKQTNTTKAVSASNPTIVNTNNTIARQPSGSYVTMPPQNVSSYTGPYYTRMDQSYNASYDKSVTSRNGSLSGPCFYNQGRAYTAPYVRTAYPYCDLFYTVELRVAGFFPLGERFIDVYGDVSPRPCYEVEASAWLGCSWEAWANLDWFSQDNKSCSCCMTTVKILNGSLGVKYLFFPCCNFNPYLGVGPSFGGLFLHNQTDCGFDEKVSRFVVGGVVKTGLRWNFNSCLFLDLFIDYLYEPVHFEKDVDIGGMKIGGGFGIRF